MVKMVLMAMLKIMMMLNMIHFLRFDKASPSPTGAENGILAVKKGSKEGFQIQGDKKKAESRSIRVKNSFFVPKMPVICWIFPPRIWRYPSPQ